MLELRSRRVGLIAGVSLREGRSQEVVHLFVVHQPKLPQDRKVDWLAGQFFNGQKMIYVLQYLRVIDFLEIRFGII